MKRKKEAEVMELMVKLYCRKKHGCAGGLCEDCSKLLEYSSARRDKCPWGDEKPFCSNCPIHCYKPDMRERVKEVMRFSGPRMIFHHPVVAVKHLVQSKKGIKRCNRAAKTDD